MFKNEDINLYMHCVMQNLYKKNAHVSIYSPADLNMGHCVQLTFLKGKLGRFLILTFFKNLLHFETESERRFNSDENCFF